MGKTTKGQAAWNGQVGMGTAYLESDSLRFRGDFRFDAALPGPPATVENGVLTLHTDPPIHLTLHEQAEKWAKYINSPPTLATKLGLKPGQAIAGLGLEDADFLRDWPATTSLESGQLYDQIFLGVRLTADLRQIGHVAAHLKPKGGIWIIYRKAQSDPSERHVIAAGRGAGLNDVKVCRFSETHTALRFVRRK